MSRVRLFLFVFVFPFIALSLQGCKVKYSLSGGSIPDNINTYTVEFFENISAMVSPTLSQNFTEGLKERIRTQSRLNQVDQDGDALFSGVITDYKISTAAVEAGNERGSMNRLTITVKVRYENRKDDTGDTNYEESFSQFKEFSGDVANQEQKLASDIILMLTETIYNRTFANW